jgi:hypothetical protein
MPGTGFWLGITREAYLAGENSIAFSLDGAVQRMDARADWLPAPVLYVDDIARNRPTHFRGPDFRDSLPKDSADTYWIYASHAGETPLILHAARTCFSTTASITHGMSLPAGWSAYAVARYGMDLYPEFAWDQVPGPESLDPASGDFNGLVLNRADGRHYAAVLVDYGSGVGEFYGTVPLQRRKARRVDQRADLDVSLIRYFRGQALSLGASARWAWSNLPRTSPVESWPWQWGVSLGWSRTWELP